MKQVSYAPPLQALILTFGLFMLGCHQEEPTLPSPSNGTIVYQTDTSEWQVMLFKEHLLYSDAVKTVLPEPWKIPTREEAQILHQLDYPHSERFITCDGYTFGMPSASVSKAGMKTQYSVLGLYIRRTIIEIEF